MHTSSIGTGGFVCEFVSLRGVRGGRGSRIAMEASQLVLQALAGGGAAPVKSDEIIGLLKLFLHD